MMIILHFFSKIKVFLLLFLFVFLYKGNYNVLFSCLNSTVNFDIVCTATAIKELCQARDMGDTQFYNRQELTIMINTLCKQ